MLSDHRCPISAILSFPAIAAVFLAVVLLPANAAWGIGFQAVNPDELKMTSEPQAPGAPAIILYRQVDRDDNRYTPHEDNYLRVKILTEEGRKQADVEIIFMRGFEQISNLHARSIKPNGTIAEFDGKVFEKTIAKGRGEAYLAKTFTIPNVEVGGIIEYYYTVDLKEYTLFESHWILSQDLFTKDARFSLKPYTSDNDYHLRWSWHLLPAGAEPKQEPATLIVRMETHNIAAFQTEDYMPPENELKSRVDFIYDQELPQPDPDKYWRSFGKKRNGALESFVGKHKAMEDAVAQIITPSDTPEVKLRKIYDRVQQIRNTSYEIQKTEQEEKRDKEKVAANVEDVWKQGFGNGVQLTWLFLALARAAGFEAYGCWVADRRNYFFDPKVEKSVELDSNVVLVKLNGKDMYFDPGGAFTPFGLLEWVETGVTGLKLDKDGGSWIQTTLPQPAESQIRREAKLQLSDTGDLEGVATVTFTGLEAMYRRLEQRHEDDTARKKYLEDSVKDEIPAAAELELTNKPDWKSAEEPLVAVLNLRIPGWASSAGKHATLPVGFFTAGDKHIFEHADRVHPLYFAYPYETVDDVTIDLPLGWQVSSVPAPQTQDGHIVVYTMKVENNNGTLHVFRKFDLDILFLESRYYPALRQFFQAVRSGDEQQILLQPAAASAGN